ncbi:MAG: apolipoprotein N-acyltransferase [bacterium]|nr:MAG: apolipoprotein N-acyltransferase [bacterium]
MKLFNLTFLRPYFLPAFSGVLLVLIFPPFNIHILAWVSLVPLLTAVKNHTRLVALKQGFCTGVICFGGVMPWIFNVLSVYGHIPALLCILLTLLLVFYLALYMAIFAWGAARAGRAPEGIFISPFVFVILEYVRARLLTGLPWALLAHSQYANPPVIQIASITGTAGVTFLIVLVNASIVYAIRGYASGGRAVGLPAAAIGLAVVNVVWGGMEVKRIEALAGREIKIAVIQGNVNQGIKWNRRYREQVINKYFRLTREAAKESPDLVVWPETAMPFYYGIDADATKRLDRLVRESSTTLIFGGLGLERTGSAIDDGAKREMRRSYFNRAYVVTPEKNRIVYYNKMHLVPFGEYVPLRRLLFFVNKMTDAVREDIKPGHRAIPVKIKDVSVGIQICYEIIFSGYVRSFVRNGAEMIVNITNDAWFGKGGASAQHMMSLPFRAVENRVPIVRAANTGISGFVTATGKIKKTTRLFETTRVSDVLTIPPPQTQNTFYGRFGDFFTYLCAFFVLAGYLRAKPRG